MDRTFLKFSGQPEIRRSPYFYVPLIGALIARDSKVPEADEEVRFIKSSEQYTGRAAEKDIERQV